MSNLLPELLPSNMKDETMDRTRLRTREAMQDLILRASPNRDSPMSPSSTAEHASASCTA